MRIVVDGRPFVKQATGVATCLRDTIIAICTYIPAWELIIVLPKPIHVSITDLPIEKLKVVVSPLFKFFNVPNFIWYHLKFPIIAKKLEADLIWGTNTELPILKISEQKRMITICDVVWKEYQSTMSYWSKYITVPFLDQSVKDADIIYSISNYTKNKIDKYFPKRKCREVFTGISCSNLFQRRIIDENKKEDIFSRYSINSNFLLFVGSLEPRKNLMFLLRLMPEIHKKTRAKLLVVGGKGWKNSDIFELVNTNEQIKNSVVFANYVSFDELVDLYNLASCYVSTSLNEGFGLPQLEAMRCGCPVISPHNSAMIEVVEGRGITIRGWDTEVWTCAITKVLTDRVFRESLSNPNLLQYDWKNIMEGLKNYVERQMP